MMNYLKKVSLLLLCSLFVQVASWAQQVQVSPVPQSVSWGEKAFESANAKYSLTKAETTDAYAVPWPTTASAWWWARKAKRP